jgi:predicted HAD superfamily hydrolase
MPTNVDIIDSTIPTATIILIFLAEVFFLIYKKAINNTQITNRLIFVIFLYKAYSGNTSSNEGGLYVTGGIGVGATIALAKDVTNIHKTNINTILFIEGSSYLFTFSNLLNAV